MFAKRLNPILNVSNIRESFAWFEKLGLKKGWDWSDPPTFGGVCSGHCEIFLCENCQGGRGKGEVKTTFGPEGSSAATKACGFQFGLTTWTPFTGTASRGESKSPGRQRTNREMCAKCMCGIRMVMSSGSVRASASEDARSRHNKR